MKSKVEAYEAGLQVAKQQSDSSFHRRGVAMKAESKALEGGQLAGGQQGWTGGGGERCYSHFVLRLARTHWGRV